MADPQKKSDVGNMLETYIRVGILEERFERHNEEQEEKIEKVLKKHEKLDDKVTNLIDRYVHEKQNMLERIKVAEIKIAAISSVAGAIISIVVTWISKKI
ncbi:MAG: hypothetical protein KBD78_04110 [Oligoflexales bacterium]|nr:hypothetical protein [Oligoflexales bacterium]